MSQYKFIHTGTLYKGSKEEESQREPGWMRVALNKDEDFDKILPGREGLYVPKYPGHEDHFKVIIECMLNEFAEWNNLNIPMRSSIKNQQLKLRIHQALRYLGWMINCDSWDETEMRDYDAKELDKRLPWHLKDKEPEQ